MNFKLEEAPQLERAGIGRVMLFGVPAFKTEAGERLEEQLAPVLETARALKKRTGLPVFADVCLCSYLTHGHCGLVKDGVVLNDESVAVLSRMAVALARLMIGNRLWTAFAAHSPRPLTQDSSRR